MYLMTEICLPHLTGTRRSGSSSSLPEALHDLRLQHIQGVNVGVAHLHRYLGEKQNIQKNVKKVEIVKIVRHLQGETSLKKHEKSIKMVKK